jgi:hypothetical protein
LATSQAGTSGDCRSQSEAEQLTAKNLHGATAFEIIAKK